MGLCSVYEKVVVVLTTKNVFRIAFAMQKNISYRFNTKIADLDWVRRFLLRHPELSIIKPEAANLTGVVRFNKINVDNFFESYSNILNNHEYTSILGQILYCFRSSVFDYIFFLLRNFVKP